MSGCTEYARIGEFSRRVGLTPERVIAWERRYGLFEPKRTSGGFRLYAPEDEHRARAMIDLLKRGVAPAEAAAEIVGSRPCVQQP